MDVEEKQRIVKYLLLNSPPGQLQEVINDCNRLVRDGHEVFTDKFLEGAAGAHNETRLQLIRLPPSSKEKEGNKDGPKEIIICPQGKIDGTHYFEPRLQQIVTVNHVLQTASSLKPPSSPLFVTETEPHRLAVQKAVGEYVRRHYNRSEVDKTRRTNQISYGLKVWVSDKSTCISSSAVFSDGAQDAAALKETDQSNLYVAISGQNVNLRNFWAASWASYWQVTFNAKTHAPPLLQGRITVTSHYFEDGNVQLSKKEPLIEIPLSQCSNSTDPAILAESVVAGIRGAETTFHMELEDTCVNLAEAAFRSLRRVLPISKEKFGWQSIRHVLMNDIIHHSNAAA